MNNPPLITQDQKDVLLSPGGRSWLKIKDLWRGKSGLSSLFKSEGDLAVLKAYEDNPENYIALEDALNTEVYSYKELSQLGIPIPQLLGVNHHKHLLLKEYIPGETVMESLGKGPLALEMLQQALNLSARAREGGFNLDWFPANFVWYGGQLIYIDYEVQPWMQEWSLEEWGIWYWLNPEGFAEFLKTKDGDTINYPGTPKPYREGIIAQRYLEFFGSKLK